MGNHFVTDGTLQKYWRLAVLKKHHNTCLICGKIRQAQDLECHHIIRRNHRITRHDVMNGAPVCKLECHRIAHTQRGLDLIKNKLGEAHLEYLYERENVMIKDYKTALSYSTVELERFELERLKEGLSMYED